MVTLYGIKNCDTVKKARNWLDSNGVEYRFHDFREDGLEASQVKSWLAELGWETLVNKRSTTWKGLDQAARDAMDDATAQAVILQQPTLIKRPLLDMGDSSFVGFKADHYVALFL